jgi:hypothetical protein
MSKKRPKKIENLLKLIRECLENERYTMTTHALIRQSERKISVAEIVHVLKTGHEEKRKTRFDEDSNKWKYAIKGKTKIDELDVRVIVAFDEFEMLIITVMDIGNL